MENITIRRFEASDAKVVSDIICRNLLEINIKDYSIEAMKVLCTFNTPEVLIVKSKERHSYVAVMGDGIVGTGSIGMEDEAQVSMIHTVFIVPERQGEGIGRHILNALEKDVFFTTSKRVKACASITALGFYLKMGYGFADKQAKLIDDDYYPVVKIRENEA